MGCSRTYLSFRVLSEKLPPDRITEILGVEPTKFREIDKQSKYKHETEFHYWSFSTKDVLESNKNEEHIQFVVDKLSGKEKELSTLRENRCSTDIYCFWQSTGSQGGPVLEVSLMSSLVSLGLSIAWDIYCEK